MAADVPPDQLSGFVEAVLLLSMRVAPTLSFAQPFTLLRLPPLIRVAMGLGLSLAMVSTFPTQTVDRLAGRNVLTIAAGELLIGLTVALSLSLAFASILWAGRALDIQAGFGLATLADPTTSAQLPLAGTILAYAGAAVFFATGAQYDLVSLWAASIERLPMGYAAGRLDLAALAEHMGSTFTLALGLIGVAVLVIFLMDLAIAFMSRTLPQMNVLLFGFQVKAMAMLILLPVCLALAGGLYLRLFTLVWQNVPRILGAG
ncbi:flagellar biosynthetic protein FliR [Novosphingobium beihaiensis]|uniref:Flagellar biosynthetic protein FliR n=1 Tax=Novosphingobium beihaiensis TaxID=2930389 RepID=A0ABT0BQL9_9SPHN|nr:flagellar biosynthetic protein FliR [Novosphingobium beihaiensis]MCJ2186974.1 flagellar biosynthetic protein FliR [Novosphingobium beihaiensis]